MKKRIAYAAVLAMLMTLLAIPSYAADSANLITNGDFESGNTGFTSEYDYVSEPSTSGGSYGLGSLDPEQHYAIGTNPSLYHQYWSSYTAYSGSNMMIVNATPSYPEKTVWSTEVSLPAAENNYPLYAGQNMLVGDILVKSDFDKIYVRFLLNDDAVADGWLITMIHVAVADDAEDIPNKNGNPIPGKFPVSEALDPGVTGTDWYCIPRDASWADPLAIAAHAVIEKKSSIVNALAPYGPGEVVDTIQGTRYDYTPVKLIRSISASAQTFEGTKLESDFYSLGFGPGDDIDDAYLTVRFDTPIINGTGPDLQIVEDTWGLPYPVESCAVYASEDGTSWSFLGTANNQTPMPDGVHTFTNFDLGSLSSATYIKVQDTSIRSDFAGLFSSQSATLDGFDINAILSLQDNKTCTVYSETAWGGENHFSGKNWANYINYSGCEKYLLSFFAANSHSDNPAVLAVTVNGETIGTANLAEIDPLLGTWNRYAFYFDLNPQTDPTAVIRIVDTFTVAQGDDFALDDITLVKQPSN